MHPLASSVVFARRPARLLAALMVLAALTAAPGALRADEAVTDTIKNQVQPAAEDLQRLLEHENLRLPATPGEAPAAMARLEAARRALDAAIEIVNYHPAALGQDIEADLRTNLRVPCDKNRLSYDDPTKVLEALTRTQTGGDAKPALDAYEQYLASQLATYNRWLGEKNSLSPEKRAVLERKVLPGLAELQAKRNGYVLIAQLRTLLLTAGRRLLGQVDDWEKPATAAVAGQRWAVIKSVISTCNLTDVAAEQRRTWADGLRKRLVRPLDRLPAEQAAAQALDKEIGDTLGAQ